MEKINQRDITKYNLWKKDRNLFLLEVLIYSFNLNQSSFQSIYTREYISAIINGKHEVDIMKFSGFFAIEFNKVIDFNNEDFYLIYNEYFSDTEVSDFSKTKDILVEDTSELINSVLMLGGRTELLKNLQGEWFLYIYNSTYSDIWVLELEISDKTVTTIGYLLSKKDEKERVVRPTQHNGILFLTEKLVIQLPSGEFLSISREALKENRNFYIITHIGKVYNLGHHAEHIGSALLVRKNEKYKLSDEQIQDVMIEIKGNNIVFQSGRVQETTVKLNDIFGYYF